MMAVPRTPAHQPAARAALLREALMATALLTACTAQADPPPPPLPPPPSATPSASPAPAALPSPSRTGTEGQIERAVLAYFAALNQAFATGNTTGYAATYTSGCKPCTQLRARLDADIAKGVTPDGLRDELSGLQVSTGTNNTGFANVTVRVPPYRLRDRSGTVTGSYPQTSAAFIITTYKTSSGWKVIDVRNASS